MTIYDGLLTGMREILESGHGSRTRIEVRLVMVMGDPEILAMWGDEVWVGSEGAQAIPYMAVSHIPHMCTDLNLRYT